MALALLDGLLAAPIAAGTSAAMPSPEPGLVLQSFEGLLCAARAGAAALAPPAASAAGGSLPVLVEAPVTPLPEPAAEAGSEMLSVEGVLSAARGGALGTTVPIATAALPSAEPAAAPTPLAQATAPRPAAALSPTVPKPPPEWLALVAASAEPVSEAEPAALSLGALETLRESASAESGDAPPPMLPPISPEPFLHWLDALKALSARLPPLAAQEPAPALPGIGLPGAAPAAITPAMVEALASNPLPETSTPMVTPSPNATPAFLLGAAPLPVPAAAPPTAGDALLAMDDANWPEALGEQIQWRLGVGIQEARIEISPRELGAVEVRLSVEDNGLKVHLSAAHAETRELLQAELPRLREALQNGGLLLADAQVGQQTPGRDPPSRNPAQTGSEARDEAGQPASETVASVGWRQRRGLLDDYA